MLVLILLASFLRMIVASSLIILLAIYVTKSLILRNPPSFSLCARERKARLIDHLALSYFALQNVLVFKSNLSQADSWVNRVNPAFLRQKHCIEEE